ncbi:MAG: protein kinase [Acidobacteriia bacterium]|nr:protein kinase [Terriglobia bacterium]
MQATLSHYRILEEIGAGGMGVVYRAHDDRLDRDVALKVLPPGTLSDEAARRRFHKEALTLSRLSHPNIATVFDFDTQEGTDFLVTEFIPGLTLDSMLAAGPLAEKEIVRLGSQLAEGLEAAHQHGVIHRDLKPGNVRITADARVKILDFGLARIVHGEAGPAAVTESLTETGLVAGTLPYMAPEQLLGSSLDPRTDIWAAGCVLYEMASGRRPFLGSGTALTDAILHQAPAPPLKLNPLLPWALEAVILKCLEKDPENRYQSARELAVDLRRLTSASATVRAAQPTRLRRRTVVIAVALPVLLALAVIAALRFGRGRNASSPPPTAPSIAVLPFVDMSPQKDQEYFADGLAEELLNSLARTPGVRVVARTSSFQFKGKNAKLADIGRELNVATILEGSVRKQANRVRITAQLINASDGFHLWSETYDRELNDIFIVQEDIAQSVAASLKVTLLGGKTPFSRGTNEEAYNAYLQGRYFYQRSSKENLEKAIGYYERAIKLDPKYALAFVGLAEAHGRQADWGYLPVVESYQKAREAARRALELNPNLAEAHAAMGLIKTIHDWDWVAADASYQRALALEPGNATVAFGAAVLALALGRVEEATALDRKAVELDPLNTQTHVNLGVATYYAGRQEEAVAALRKALELDPERPYAHAVLGQVYLAQSHPQEALAEMEREPDLNWRLYGLALANHALGRARESDAALAELTAKYDTTNAFQVAEVYAFRGEVDRAFEWLERAYAQRDGGLTWIKGDPLLKSLQRDPRYAAFLKKMRLPAN